MTCDRPRTIVVLLTVLCGPLTSAAQPAGTETEAGIFLEQFSCHYGAIPLRVDESLRQIRSLGKVQEEISRRISDVREVRRVVFAGLVIEVILNKDTGISLIGYVNVTRPRWKVFHDVQVGMKISDLLAKLDASISVIGPSFKVCGDTDCATFHTEAGRIVRIEYDCYTG